MSLPTRQGPAVEICSASKEHLPAIAELAGIVWRAHYPGIITPEQIEYMLARMYDLTVMREELGRGIRYDQLLVDDRLAGFSSYGAAGAGEVKLHKLYIHPDTQRHGFGSRMLAHVEQESRQGGFATLILAVNKNNHKAIAAYRKNGFTIRECVVSDIGGGFVMDDYIMAKALA